MYYDKRESYPILDVFTIILKTNVTFYMYFVVMYEGRKLVKRNQSLEDIYSNHMHDLFRYLLS